MTLRRDFLAMTAGAVAAKTVLPMAARAQVQVPIGGKLNPDATLLAACTAFLTHWDAMPVATGRARVCGTPECHRHEEAVEAHVERGDELAEPVIGMPATTLAGLQAKARVLIAWDGGNWIAPKGELSGRLLFNMLADLDGMTAR